MTPTRTKANGIVAKTRVLCFKVTPEQYDLIVGRAEQRGVPISLWMRSILVQATKSPKNGRYIRIHEPDGATI